MNHIPMYDFPREYALNREEYLELFDKDFLLGSAGSFYGELHISWPCTLKGFIECRPGCTEQFYPINVRHGGTDPESIPEW